MADKKISALPAATLPLAGTEVLPIVQGGTTDKVAVNDLTVRNLRANATTGILQVTGPAAGTTRVMTAPDANFTVARTDAAQTFTGDQTTNGRVTSAVADANPAIVANATNGHVRIIPYLDGVSYSTIIAYAAGYSGFGPLSLDGLNLRLCSTGTARLTISNLGDVTANTGNIVVGTAGKGIDFSANTHAAGMTSELLNDYEEGTFTPVLSSSATPPTVTSYLNQYGAYTKIGNRVFATVNIRAVMTNAGTGYPVITGLPYAAAPLCANGPAWGLANILNIGINGNFVSGTTVQMISSSYNIVNDYLCFSIMYEV
jgi:hypothetical protein